MDQEEWDELWAEAREMSRIEDRQIGIGEEAWGDVHHAIHVKIVFGNAWGLWRGVKSCDLRLGKSLGRGKTIF